MKTEPNDLIHPFHEDASTSMNEHLGLTKREYFALQILNGLLSNSGGPLQANPMSGTGYANGNMDSTAQMAVAQADALIEALNKD